jgi:indolepyruvate ferredoxin oxidoreductase alpha subunit
LSGNDAVAWGALHAGANRGTGYPGTPSTEILETFSLLGGAAAWSPNEKVAAEVALGVAFAGGRALVTMKHVGLNVASDVLYTATYSGVQGAYVWAVADDPGMASSQNEQDSRRHAWASGTPVLEPADSQEAYDFTRLAFVLSQRHGLPVILRMTTRVSHSHSEVHVRGDTLQPHVGTFERRITERVMVPAHARPAHRRLREKLALLSAWSEAQGPHAVTQRSPALGIIVSGVAALHAAEAAPDASLFKLGMTHPLPLESLRAFAASVRRCLVIEENDPVLFEQLRAAGIAVEPTPPAFRFGELDVGRIRRIVSGEGDEAPLTVRGTPPQLCKSCPHRTVFGILKDLDCIVAGDIGCYTLAALPPLASMDIQICMGASIGTGLGLRHVLPPNEARRVVSVIGDSTFVHSGLTGIAEMVYNVPPTGHLVIILDNETTAMTGMQEHPGTGRRMDHSPANRLVFEDVVAAMGVPQVRVFDPAREAQALREAIVEALRSDTLSVFVVRQPCLLAAGKRRDSRAATEPAATKGGP